MKPRRRPYGGPDDPGGAGVTQGDPLVAIGGPGGLRTGELRGGKSARGESGGRAEQCESGAEACHESPVDAASAALDAKPDQDLPQPRQASM